MNDNEKWPRTSPGFNTTREAYENQGATVDRIIARATPTDDERDETTDENLWDFAGDLLDAWNIEDTNAPSLAEDFRDRFVARFRRTEVPEPSAEHQKHADARRAETMTLISHAERQGEPSEARGIIARALTGEARMDTFSAWNLADDIVAALRAANEVR